jgi:hypothetical protein
VRWEEHDAEAKRLEARLHLAATITPELLPVLCPNDRDRPEGRSQITP